MSDTEIPISLVFVLALAIIIIFVCSRRRIARESMASVACMCGRDEAARAAWTSSQPACPERWSGLSPLKHPSRACSYRALNPFFPIYGAALPITLGDEIVDAPISRMVGDHVPPE